MDQSMAVEVVRRALIESFWISAPLLLVAFLAGAIISLVQIVHIHPGQQLRNPSQAGGLPGGDVAAVAVDDHPDAELHGGTSGRPGTLWPLRP